MIDNLRRFVALFSDGHQSPIIVKGDFQENGSLVHIGLAHNRAGFARVLFFHDSGHLAIAHDPWLIDNRVESITISQVGENYK